jgi:hypothetical protein
MGWDEICPILSLKIGKLNFLIIFDYINNIQKKQMSNTAEELGEYIQEEFQAVIRHFIKNAFIDESLIDREFIDKYGNPYNRTLAIKSFIIDKLSKKVKTNYAIKYRDDPFIAKFVSNIINCAYDLFRNEDIIKFIKNSENSKLKTKLIKIKHVIDHFEELSPDPYPYEYSMNIWYNHFKPNVYKRIHEILDISLQED